MDNEALFAAAEALPTPQGVWLHNASLEPIGDGFSATLIFGGLNGDEFVASFAGRDAEAAANGAIADARLKPAKVLAGRN